MFYMRYGKYFYPRSPCGERLPKHIQPLPMKTFISIHALLAESDRNIQHAGNVKQRISTHALLAESDGSITVASVI